MLTSNDFATEEEFHAALQIELESGDQDRVSTANANADQVKQVLGYENFASYMTIYKTAHPSDEWAAWVS